MLKFRANLGNVVKSAVTIPAVFLRKVATIVACLVVTTMFATCDNKNGDDDGNGTAANIDPKLVGSWGYFGDKTMPRVYIFNQDGTFLYYSALHTSSNPRICMENIYKGKYSVNANKITFTNVFISRFDRDNDNENCNKIGDRTHAKEMLKTTTGFVTWTLEPLVYNFIETGIVRIKKELDEENSHQLCRADWETHSGW